MKPTVFPANETIDFSKKLNVKFGIDPTSDKLHLGHLIPLLELKKLWKNGHEIHLVLGTFTAQLGDPSGKNEMRPILSSDETHKNAESLLEQVARVFDNVDGNNPLFKNIHIHRNGDWFDRMTAIQMTELLSKFTVGQLLERDSFQKRLEEKNPIGMHELVVPILQGFDSVKTKADIELGGTDQMFNFAITRDVQRIHGQEPEKCLLMPIINGTDGRKMSKSFGNCIVINDSPNDVFGKVMSISDKLMQEWWSVIIGDITEIGIDKRPMEMKKELAWHITDIIWKSQKGELANEAQKHFEQVIQNKKNPEVFDIVTMTEHDDFISLVVCIRKCSISEAKRLIGQGAVKVNGIKVLDENTSINFGDTIKIGKLDFAKVVS
jgi:tyrosyl-tRNA synthetase